MLELAMLNQQPDLLVTARGNISVNNGPTSHLYCLSSAPSRFPLPLQGHSDSSWSEPNNAAACFHVGHRPSSLVSNVNVCVLRLPPLRFIADLIVPMAVAPAKSPTFQSSTQPHNSPTEMSSDFLAGCLHASIYCPKWVVSLHLAPFQTHRGLCLKRGRITPVSVTKTNLCWFARVPP